MPKKTAVRTVTECQRLYDAAVAMDRSTNTAKKARLQAMARARHCLKNAREANKGWPAVRECERALHEARAMKANTSKEKRARARAMARARYGLKNAIYALPLWVLHPPLHPR